MKPMRLVVIDDDHLFRSAIKSVLKSLDSNVEISHFAEFNGLEDRRVDVVLLDYHLDGGSLDHNLTKARLDYPNAKIVIVSADEAPLNIVESIDLGAAGFIPKSSDPAVLIAALKIILLGQAYLPPQVLHVAKPSTKKTKSHYLSINNSQRRVLSQVLAGKANKVIAAELNIALGTVKCHLTAAFKSLGVSNRTEAVIVLSQHPELLQTSVED